MAFEELSLLKARLILTSCAALAALSLAGCDRDGGQVAQESDAVDGASETAVLVGEPDPIFSGSEIPEVTLVDPEGAELALAEVGEPVLLNLWATWCAPCVVEMPLLDGLAADYEGRLQVITVNEDGRGAEIVTRFFAEHDLPNLPQWIDPDFAVSEAFGGGPGLPITVFYNADGVELWRVIGDYDWAGEEARARIDEALAASER